MIAIHKKVVPWLAAAALLTACSAESDKDAQSRSISSNDSRVALDLAVRSARALSADEEKPSTASGVPATTSGDEGVKELEWDALIPAAWRPEKLLDEYDASNLSDDDPRAVELMNKLKALWSEAPVVEELDGKTVKLPGFVVPLETDGQKMSQFLLVPYYGACIHVPPPPSNQTVYVVTEQGREYRGKLFDTVWVTGMLGVKAESSELANAGYTLYAEEIKAYE